MPILGDWHQREVVARRCDCKRYMKLSKALREAERMSKLQNKLLIAYDCIDCGGFHVGHADKTQQLAHQVRRQINWGMIALKYDCPSCTALAGRPCRTVYHNKDTKESTARNRRGCHKERIEWAKKQQKLTPEDLMQATLTSTLKDTA